MKQHLIVFSLRTGHFLSLIFLTFGWTFSHKSILLFHVIFVPLVFVQWYFNEGTCVLSNIESRIKGERFSKRDQQGYFIKSLLGYFFKPLPKDQTIKVFIYFVLFVSWFVSCIKIMS